MMGRGGTNLAFGYGKHKPDVNASNETAVRPHDWIEKRLD